jgi:uncharacterized protein (TIGR03032 family)
MTKKSDQENKTAEQSDPENNAEAAAASAATPAPTGNTSTQDDANPVSPQDEQKAAEAQVTYSVSPGLLGFLASTNISIALSSYQSGKFYLLGRNPKGGIMINERFFNKAMGIHTQDNAIVLATLTQLLRFENILDDNQFINDTFDACYVPRVAYTTGVLDAHDVGLMQDGRIVFVNTRYNCLAVASQRHSFTPIWKPSFISKIIDEDRCHLNGMAMQDGKPRYVTAVSRSDTIDGWRDRRADGGIIIDVDANKVVCGGLSMPHSPRIYRDKLWVLNSGTGEFGWVEIAKTAQATKFHPVTFCPGFVRGLAFHGKYAFIGLSKPRYQRFEGLKLDKSLQDADSEPWCGLQIIDLDTGTCVQWFRIDGAVAEMYDVAVVPGVRCGMALGFGTGEIMSLITHDELPAEK